MEKKYSISFDGLSCSGKSTMAQMLSLRSKDEDTLLYDENHNHYEYYGYPSSVVKLNRLVKQLKNLYEAKEILSTLNILDKKTENTKYNCHIKNKIKYYEHKLEAELPNKIREKIFKDKTPKVRKAYHNTLRSREIIPITLLDETYKDLIRTSSWRNIDAKMIRQSKENDKKSEIPLLDITDKYINSWRKKYSEKESINLCLAYLFAARRNIINQQNSIGLNMHKKYHNIILDGSQINDWAYYASGNKKEAWKEIKKINDKFSNPVSNLHFILACPKGEILERENLRQITSGKYEERGYIHNQTIHTSRFYNEKWQGRFKKRNLYDTDSEILESIIYQYAQGEMKNMLNKTIENKKNKDSTILEKENEASKNFIEIEKFLNSKNCATYSIQTDKMPTTVLKENIERKICKYLKDEFKGKDDCEWITFHPEREFVSLDIIKEKKDKFYDFIQSDSGYRRIFAEETIKQAVPIYMQIEDIIRKELPEWELEEPFKNQKEAQDYFIRGYKKGKSNIKKIIDRQKEDLKIT
jgi:thymidylate kinase